MGSSADITIIVPTFNRADYLPDCLRSLLDQRLQARELIVVDDGSTDRTPEILTSFGARIKVVRKSNGGKSSALNCALRVATGAAIWIFDDDDIALPHALERLHGALAGNPDAGFAAGDLLRFRERDGLRSFWRAPSRVASADDFLFQQLTRMTVFQGAMLVRRACFDVTGPFDETLARAQDYDMLVRLAARFDPVLVPSVLFHQRQHEAVRGTAALRIDGREVWRRQNDFDAVVVRKARQALPSAAILPRSHRLLPVSPDRAFEARLRWAAVVGRRGDWGLAAGELEAALALASGHGIEAATPTSARAIADTLLLAADRLEPEVKAMLAMTASMPGRHLRRQLLGALTWQLFLRAGKAAARRRPGPALRAVRDYARVTRGRFVAGHLRMLVDHVRNGRARRVHPSGGMVAQAAARPDGRLE